MTKDAIRYILKNIIYTGKIKYAGNIYQGIHDPIIPEDLHNEVQKNFTVKNRRWRQYKTFLFGGLVKCGQCNNAMSPCFTSKKSNENRVDRFYYYRCIKTYKRDWSCCDIKHVNANRLEDYVFECLNRISVDRHYLHSSSLNRESRCRDELNVLWPENEVKSLQKHIKSFLNAAEKINGTSKCQLIKNYVRNIIYNKETIQVNIYWETTSYNEEGILEQASTLSESATADERREEIKKINLLNCSKIGNFKKQNSVLSSR